jgi:hypothetical protein
MSRLPQKKVAPPRTNMVIAPPQTMSNTTLPKKEIILTKQLRNMAVPIVKNKAI